MEISKNVLEEFYINQNMTKEEICDKFNITNYSLSKLLKEYNLKKDYSSIVKKRQQTCLDRYGVDNPSKTDVIREVISRKQKVNSSIIVEKGKKTKLERYGDENYNNYSLSEKTKLERYGDAHYNNREKNDRTIKEKYNVENVFQLDSTKKSIIDSLIDKKEYTEIFRNIFKDREKAIEFLKDKEYSYFDLCNIFNCSYDVVQQWIVRMNLKEYINFKFTGKSHYEDEIVKFLKELEIENIIRNSLILNGQEIDIYLPDYKIGIEFNGTYWHSDMYKEKNYHLNKSKEAEKLGIRLIHIYQYEWDNSDIREKIKSLLRIALGKITNKIYARECEIKKIDNHTAQTLNNSNHLQNHRNAQVTYGLYYKDELVQLMSFSKHRKYEWEIVRGCPGSNNIVIGGVSKLFKHFLDDYNPNEVFSYCDFNKFDGHSYETLGMKFIGYTGPDMKYIIKGNVVNRQPSRYKEIKDSIDAKIYGAGSKKYLWTKENS